MKAVTDAKALAMVEAQIAEFGCHLDDAVENVSDELGLGYFDVHDMVSRAKIERASA